MRLPINYVNDEEERKRHTRGTAVWSDRFENGLLSQHLSQSVSSPTWLAVLRSSFFALNLQMESVASLIV